jgi:hypothetical protein
MQRARRVAGWAGLGFVLLQIGWILVMPPAAGIDEFDHLYRADSVAMGNWKPGAEQLPQTLARGGLIPVRSSLVDASTPACADLDYTTPFNCRPFRRVNSAVVDVASAAARYNPTYYAIVGTVARPFSGNAAIYAMRIASALVCAAIFVFAAFIATGCSRSKWPLVATLLAVLPTTVYSTSLAAPNGANMLSGLLVWTAVAGLARQDPTFRGASYLGLGAGAAILANTHTLGLLWLLLIGLTWIVYAGPARTLMLLRPRNAGEWGVLASSATAMALALWWVQYAQPNMSGGTEEGGLPGHPWHDILASVPLWVLQGIGAFPFRNEPAPPLLYAVALVVLMGVAAALFRSLRRDPALTRLLATVLFVSVAVPVTLTYATYGTLGLSWQGRYGMPYTVGLFVVAGLALDRGRQEPRRSLLVIGTCAWVFAHVVGQSGVLEKQTERHALLAATGWWAPPLILVGITGLLAAATWTISLGSAAGGASDKREVHTT